MKTMLLAAAVAALDQAIKRLVRAAPAGALLWDASPVFQLTHVDNTGAAFSLFRGNPAPLAVVSLLLLSLLLWLLRRARLTRGARISLALLLGGGAGNLIDRLIFGGVTDYVRLVFIRFPVFNLADAAVTAGVAALLALLFTGKLEERK